MTEWEFNKVNELIQASIAHAFAVHNKVCPCESLEDYSFECEHQSKVDKLVSELTDSAKENDYYDFLSTCE